VKIALVSNFLPPVGRGGAELYVSELAEALTHEHDVTVFSGSLHGEAGGATVRRIPSLPPLSPNSSLAGKAAWHARDQWLRSVHLALARGLEALAPDVVHSHEPQGLSAAVFTAIARAGIPHVHTAHDLNLLCAQVTMTRGGAFCGGRCAGCAVQRFIRGRLIRRRLDALICHSNFIRERHLAAEIVAAESIVTIPFGVRAGQARLRTFSPYLRIGFLGSLTPQKGLLTLLAAFSTCPPTWELAVAGSGPLEPLIRERVQNDRRTHYAGFVSGSDKEMFFEKVDVVVIPSEMEEAASLVAIEAAARGIPAIVSNRGGLPELPHVIVFEAGRVDSLRGALSLFAAEPGRLEAASKSLLDVSEQFKWSHHVDRVEAVLKAAAHPNDPDLSAGRGLRAGVEHAPENSQNVFGCRVP
jgi:glycosyltransferase involved in cell wall biosynthesis